MYLPTQGLEFDLRSFILAMFEMLRRWQWNFRKPIHPSYLFHLDLTASIQSVLKTSTSGISTSIAPHGTFRFLTHLTRLRKTQMLRIGISRVRIRRVGLNGFLNRNIDIDFYAKQTSSLVTEHVSLSTLDTLVISCLLQADPTLLRSRSWDNSFGVAWGMNLVSELRRSKGLKPHSIFALSPRSLHSFPAALQSPQSTYRSTRLFESHRGTNVTASFR